VISCFEISVDLAGMALELVSGAAERFRVDLESAAGA
jgi:hypothetical protein